MNNRPENVPIATLSGLTSLSNGKILFHVLWYLIYRLNTKYTFLGYMFLIKVKV